MAKHSIYIFAIMKPFPLSKPGVLAQAFNTLWFNEISSVVGNVNVTGEWKGISGSPQ